MNFTIKEVIEKKQLKLGDVVVVYGAPYQIHKEGGKFIAKSFDGYSASTGFHETLDSLRDSFNSFEWEHYSKDDFELQLIRRKRQK